MAVGNVVGRAYIEIHADSKPFAKELGVEVEAIAKSAETSTKAKSAGRTVARDVIRGARTTVRREGRGIFSTLLDDLAGRRGTTNSAFRRAGRQLGRSLVGFIGIGVQEAGKGGFNLISALGSSVGNVGGKGGFGAAIGAAIAGLVAGAILGIQQIAGLTASLLLLPGILTSLAGAIAPVVVAFHGLGDAFAAVMANDPQALAEALKSLTPSARSFVLEFQKLKPVLHDIHVAAQENFFKHLKGDLTTAGKVLGPVFKEGIGKVADAAGVIADQFLKLFTSPDGQKFFTAMFNLGTTLINKLGPAILTLVNGFMNLVSSQTGMDMLGRVVSGIANGIATFGLWLDKISKNGKLQDFFNAMSRAFDALMAAASLTWSLAEALFGSDPESLDRNAEVFKLLGGVIQQLVDFLKSDLGKHGLTSLLEILVIIAGVFSAILQTILSIGGALEWAGEKLGEFYAFLTGKPKPPAPIFIPGAPKPGEPGGIPIKSQPAPGGKGHAEGAMINGPEYSLLGEKGPEVVIPLTNPNRARQLMMQSGLMSMAGGDHGDVNVYIGNEKIDAHVERVQARGFRAFGRGLKYGPRPIGAYA